MLYVNQTKSSCWLMKHLKGSCTWNPTALPPKNNLPNPVQQQDGSKKLANIMEGANSLKLMANFGC